MKSLLIVLMTLSSINSFAKTMVKIPLFVEEKNKLVPMAEINKKFKTKFPTELVVTDAKGSVDTAHDLYWDIYHQFEDIKGYELANDIPGNNRVNDIRTCYTGDAATAVDLTMSMGDSIYSDQLGMYGWKYKKEMHLEDDSNNDEAKKAIDAESKLWKNWKGYDDTILILTHQSDDGGEVNEGLIVKCK